MTVRMDVLEGALRVRLSEDQWRAATRDADVPAGVGGALEPLPAGDEELPSETCDPALVSATRLALGSGPIHLDLTAMTDSRGLVASLGSDGQSAAGAVRVLLAPESRSGATTLVPGVEVSAVPVDRLIGELMRLFPPDVRTGVSTVLEPVTLPEDMALVLTRAVQEGNDRLAQEVASQCGFSEVPELLVALADDVRGSVTLGLWIDGSDSLVVRRWLQCELGWISLAVADGQVTHTHCTRQDIHDDLVYVITGALEFSQAETDPDE